MEDLKKDIQYVKGVGEARAKTLKLLDINTLEDLISYYPRSYEDRSKITKISESVDSEKCVIEGTVISSLTVRMLGRSRSIEKTIIKDDTDTCIITWFNQPYLRSQIKRGETYRFYGKMTIKRGVHEMMSPVFDKENQENNTGRIVPIYPLTHDINQNAIRKIIQNGLELVGKIEEELPDYIVNKYNLLSLDTATRQIHMPTDFSKFKKARYRLVFDELLSMQLGLLKLRCENQKEIEGISFDKNVSMNDVINDFPFKLTKAQIRVLEEINADLESSKTMNRLLQGDVGSGKTAVAMCACYKAVKSGYQAVMLAPTMILANQHYSNFEKMLSKYGIRIGLVVGNMKAKEKRETLEKIANGEIDIIIGTHAILEENVEFKNLGLVVTDEQHRFGVKQRSKIIAKGHNPDVLVMSATPIPRTLALILYGDLDISIIDELPPNRKVIETYAVPQKIDDRVNNFIKKELDSGRQAYVVCPLVEESEEIEDELYNVTELTKKYKEGFFKNYRVEALHGKMKPKEKDEIMQKFKNHEIDILVSTTVIEVGIDVPNASIMVIENAERFGLAQLHQLRGRVGRGEYESYCILKYNSLSQNTKERLEVMCKTNDGMVIAEKDLELRGSGDFFGTAQHGLPEFRIANLFEDVEELKEVQSLAMMIISKDPLLEKEENKKLNALVEKRFSSKEKVVM